MCLKKNEAVRFLPLNGYMPFEQGGLYLRWFVALGIFFVAFEKDFNTVGTWENEFLHLRASFQISCTKFCKRK